MLHKSKRKEAPVNPDYIHTKFPAGLSAGQVVKITDELMNRYPLMRGKKNKFIVRAMVGRGTSILLEWTHDNNRYMFGYHGIQGFEN